MDDTTFHASTILFLFALATYVRLKWLQKEKKEFRERATAAQTFAALSTGLVLLNLEPASSVFSGAATAGLVGLFAAACIIFAGVGFNHIFTADCPDIEKQDGLERYKMGASAALAGGCWLFLVVKMLIK